MRRYRIKIGKADFTKAGITLLAAIFIIAFVPVCCDSCLEFFFQIEGEENYFNFEINPNGCMCIQYGKEERFDIVWENSKEYFAVTTNETADGWEVFYRIPLKFIRLFHRDFAFDRNIMANLYKCGNYTVHKHFIAWMPVNTESPDFHRPEYFGKMTFEAAFDAFV